jgi:hypothetical protein
LGPISGVLGLVCCRGTAAEDGKGGLRRVLLDMLMWAAIISGCIYHLILLDNRDYNEIQINNSLFMLFLAFIFLIISRRILSVSHTPPMRLPPYIVQYTTCTFPSISRIRNQYPIDQQCWKQLGETGL